MKLEEIEESLSKDILKLGYHLYSLKYIKKDKILEVLIDETLDLESISKLSEKVSKLMDKYDDELDDYLLDVASAGCEREIKKEAEIKKAIGKYIHVETKDIKLDGVLKAYKDDLLNIEYLAKNIKKKIEVKKKDIKNLRYAVNLKEKI